ncbi:protein-L-isoaspartate O-methyltransferase [Shimia sp. R10_1]|uniref:protein-L-isoaspartate O-methyltransferase family protein n=1 Tax=Shimia sp. R10_1 TaxID=2821095 RepID=UPI001ADA0A4E|nr:protein-L-isoaspartate O-methyltransferase [Shimia sp. R10_1]MBO9474889.1 protein-L-isoaspartate O-methyltransferase [Shimia sp. R10_1]
MADFAQLRTTMVDTQVRPSDVTKYTVIDALLSVPREAYVPSGQRAAAYVDGCVPLGAERVVLDARTLAKMLDALDVQKDDLVLDVGAGLGYSSAVVAHMAEVVIAVEDDTDRAAEAQSNFNEQGVDNAIVHCGPLSEGAMAHGPYDVILVQGGVQQLPDGLLGQLKDGGRICALFVEGALGIARIGYKLDGKVNWRFAFNASAPVMPDFEKHRAFEL